MADVEYDDGLDPTARAWLEEASGSRVTAVHRLPGGMSSAIHWCEMGGAAPLVLRHIRDREWLRREPHLITYERRALELLAATSVPAPRHVASSPDDGLLLMSHLPGTMRVDAAGLACGARQIAAVARAIASVPLPDPDPSGGRSGNLSHPLPAWRPWVPHEPEPPDWARDTGLWDEAISRWDERTANPDALRPQPQDRVLLHRDLHPLNLLWADGRIAGVVDWVNACIGHRLAELGHCRWNLAVLAGHETADAFLTHALAGSGDGDGAGDDRWDPIWDLAPVLSFIDAPIGTAAWHAVGRRDLTPDRVIAATEDFVRKALTDSFGN